MSFIEVTETDGDVNLVNIQAIVRIVSTNGGTELSFLVDYAVGNAFIHVRETYEEVKQKIREAK